MTKSHSTLREGIVAGLVATAVIREESVVFTEWKRATRLRRMP